MRDLLRAMAFALVVLSCSSPLCAADVEVPAGFQALFNGRDLAGWLVHKGDRGRWDVSNGVLHCLGRGVAGC